MVIYFVASNADGNETKICSDRLKAVAGRLDHEVNETLVGQPKSACQHGDCRCAPCWRETHNSRVEALSRADIIIVEASTTSFSVGFFVAMAIQQKKPTLILMRDVRKAVGVLAGMNCDLMCLQEYNDDTLDDILEKFIAANVIESKDLRFNFFIDRKIYNYLRWSAQKTGKTKAEILRELVSKEIEKNGEATRF
jgi:hypothetical protein